MTTGTLPAAFLLDLIVGDPPWLPHPVRGIGRAAQHFERACRRHFGDGVFSGLAATCGVLVAVASLTAVLVLGARKVSPLAASVVDIVLIYVTIAPRDLHAHGMAVRRALESGDLSGAREKVGLIVGRDTAHLNEPEVVRAAVESVAESTLDAVAAPLFYAALLGPVGAVLYRAANTLDSMWGYRNARYERFGRIAARFDDVLNYIPARFNAALMCVAAAFVMGRGSQAWRVLRRDGRNHTSPNAGLSEAAMAGALGVRLGGTNIYFGKPVPKPTIGDQEVPLGPGHIAAANRIMWTTTALVLAVATTWLWLKSKGHAP